MKGQLEIFGLAIIFVLVLLALMLYLRFGGTTEEEAEDFYFKQLPGRILNSMKETTTGCRGQNIETLIIDVADNADTNPDEECAILNSQQQIECSGGSNPKYSADVLFEAIDDILEKTLEESFINYDFEIKFVKGCTIYKKSFNVNEVEGCSRARKVDASTLTFATDNGKVDMMLRIC